MSKPTINDVARAAEVSRATVSRVMNNAPGASGPLRERVRLAAAELGYKPNETARTLASGRPRSVDVIAVDDDPAKTLGTDPYYSRVLAGLTPVLDRADIPLRIQPVPRAQAAETIDAIAAQTTAGAILANITPDLAARFHSRCHQVVSLVPTLPWVAAVEADNAGGATKALDHLYELGRRRIAAIHGPATNTCAIERRTGYRQAVAGHGLTDLSADGDFTREGGYLATREILRRHPDIDALFVASDMMAAGAIQAITATGRSVPGDVSVVGFDDSVAAICTNPPLTTVRLPTEQMAATAAELLLSGAIGPGYRHHVPVELIRRDSAR
jgi:DNA-binding LacI/PurR family transcriptional regulator